MNDKLIVLKRKAEKILVLPVPSPLEPSNKVCQQMYVSLSAETSLVL